MADALVEKLIADLAAGARETEGLKRGSRANVEISRDRGHEEKIALFTMSDPKAVAQHLVHGSAPAIGTSLPKMAPPPVPAAARRGPPPIPMAKAAHDQGRAAAARSFGLEKAAFLPALLGMAGSLAGPMMARAGLGALARGAGGKMLGGLAGKILPHAMGSGLAGKAFDVGAGILGGSLGSRLGGAQPQQQMSPVASGLGGYVGGRYMPQPRMPEGPWQG